MGKKTETSKQQPKSPVPDPRAGAVKKDGEPGGAGLADDMLGRVSGGYPPNPC
jgi:hypothetical protein